MEGFVWPRKRKKKLDFYPVGNLVISKLLRNEIINDIYVLGVGRVGEELLQRFDEATVKQKVISNIQKCARYPRVEVFYIFTCASS